MENKNGQGIFLGVVGVATLIVAIIGATFAFFSAQAQSNNGDISGQTLGGQGAMLTLSVEKVWDRPTAASSLDLVPAANISTSNLNKVLSAKCESTATTNENDTTKYTGCHVYRITATSKGDIAGANVKLTSLTNTAPTAQKSMWKWIAFTDDAEASGTFSSPAGIADGTGQFEVEDGTFDFNKGAAMTANTPKKYFLLIYLENEQNDQSQGATKDATGSYTGTITFTAAGGSEIKATFSA